MERSLLLGDAIEQILVEDGLVFYTKGVVLHL